MTAAYASLRNLLAGAGYDFVEPAILFEARIFVELAGEDLRRRLFLANAADGTEMALRPDYTIPVCLQHLASGAAKRRAGYAYLGPIFRQRANESGEFLQAGVESLGRNDRAAADADLLKLALEAVVLLGAGKTSVRIGDSALFAAVLATLDLGEPWRRRLARAFGDTPRLKALVAKLSGGDQAAPVHEGFLAALDGADHDGAHRVVEDLLALAGIRTVGGRTAGEIADRFLEKASLAAGVRNGARLAKVLNRFLDLAGAPDKAATALRALARAERLDIGKAVDAFEARVENFRKHGIDLGRLAFAADFGRRLDYYTGFVFEVHDARRSDGRPLVGGGRYDRLLALLGAAGPVPAVGFSIWLDRFGGAK
jgi:ATP phosphoribosyltransferase regulatory subunit